MERNQLTCGTATGIQREHGLDGDVHSGGVEGFEHDLCHLFSVGLWIQRCFCQHDFMIPGINVELVEKRVIP